MKQGDSSKAKTKVWQNKSKGAKKTAKSKKKKLTKKKATPAPAKTKQANGNVAGNVSVQSHLKLLDDTDKRATVFVRHIVIKILL